MLKCYICCILVHIKVKNIIR